jgi:hypothetical protein
MRLRSLLISKSVELSTVRALPGNTIAGHAPHIFQHTDITDLKSTSAPPAKRQLGATAMTFVGTIFTPLFPVFTF